MVPLLESIPNGGLALHCGICGAVFDASTATIGELAFEVCGHMEQSHGMAPRDARQCLARVRLLR